MEFQSLAKQALPLHRQNVVAELVPKGLPWSSANLLYGISKLFLRNLKVAATGSRRIYPALSSCMEFQSSPSSMFPLPKGRGWR